MSTIMRYKLSFDKDNFNEENNCINIGGNTFIINGMEIPFDFAAFNYNLEEKKNRIYLEYESGKGFLCDEHEVDPCFKEDYKKLGLSIKDITAEFLASTEEINEMYLCFEDIKGYSYFFSNIKYEYIEFEDLKTEKTYEVKQEVINKYNKYINKQNYRRIYA